MDYLCCILELRIIMGRYRIDYIYKSYTKKDTFISSEVSWSKFWAKR